MPITADRELITSETDTLLNLLKEKKQGILWLRFRKRVRLKKRLELEVKADAFQVKSVSTHCGCRCRKPAAPHKGRLDRRRRNRVASR